MKALFKLSVLLSAVISLSVTLLLISSPAFAKHAHHKGKKAFAHNPVIFIHGSSGSASQFESQAMRFMSNGYPKDHIHAMEYDSSAENPYVYWPTVVYPRLDALIAQVLETTGKTQVDLMGHSMGTFVSQYYLNSNPARAAKVAHYVNIDGISGKQMALSGISSPPGGVETMALWAGMTYKEEAEIDDAQNVVIDNQTHVEVCTSAESFFEMYSFFTGTAPQTTRVVPETWGLIEIAGRACLFPENIGVDGAMLEIYRISHKTGNRLSKHPRAVFEIGEDGNFGPFKARAGERFEFVIIRDGQDHHFYKESFLRSDYFVRLNTSRVGEGIGASMDTHPEQANLIISRDKEFWGERPLEKDILAINGVDVINEVTGEFINRTNVVYVFDQNADGISYIDEPVGFLHSVPFMTGVDLFVPTDMIRITAIPRGGNGKMQIINIPGWASDYHRISVQFNDFVQ
ncbi:MAG: alpha/beta hydrolase [Proteobacteria bacterium]|nr:alpha/beta hydrolase [Pseudomonadota bacterium]MBU1387932.1 alpha/beta hydrolase [Pseudomonadota bacterium]MBU1541995.1 alpha/beta hydrolase [Pseudomonadota bacterium]MBU2429639.1 alpha/beta hydrolase [Pseudomonadota bacterium]MBU2480085.1 alpha/beta hydrolase [Pseudomonadota bacterium]